MDIEIRDSPVEFDLVGLSSAVEGHCYGEVGMRLMNRLWEVVKARGVATTGINHWVYLANGDMFVGVELRDRNAAAEPLEPLKFQLDRYLQHVHVGPYDQLPAKWAALRAELAARGETIDAPSLEVYGHCSPDPALAETTILIALAPRGRD